MNDNAKRSMRGRIKTVLCLWALGSLGVAYGCSSSDSPSEPSGTGGGAGTGGGGNAACGTNINDPGKYPACSTCTGGRCVPKTIVTTAGIASLLTACDADNVCVPDNIVAMGENLLLKTCTSIGGAVGRCASTCIGAVASLQAYLPQDTCAQNERCAPCFNPANGQATGICGLGCDQSPPGQPVTFGKCCGADGLCAPKSALPQDLAAQLGPETCANASTDVCVPAKPIATPGARFACCTGGGMMGAPTYSGACIAACVIDQGPAGSQIQPGSCGANEKCVPCANPLTNPPSPTGVCTDAAGQPVTTCTP